MLLIIPLIGLVLVSSIMQQEKGIVSLTNHSYTSEEKNRRYLKLVALTTSIVTLIVTLIIFILFDFTSNNFQFIQSHSDIIIYSMNFGVDGSSIYFMLLTSIIMPISLLSNWTSISQTQLKPFLIIILLLETLLLSVFLVVDGFLFYIFFESILPPLFLLIGMFGSINKIRASFYLFLYTLLGSLFMLLAILKMSSIAGFTLYDAMYKLNFLFYMQLFFFSGIFIAFAVKTPTIFLNTWLLKAHVESPLSGSIILAGIVLKLSLYGVFRLILPLLAKAYIIGTTVVFSIGFITIFYGSLSTIRTVDVKELIAYSSVCHAAVYLMGVFSNVVTGIEGGILLGLAHGFVSSGLFICVGGVLYDRTSTRLISIYRGMTQLMPLFSVVFFILCLGNCGVPLTFNFIGEFMSLYGIFERHVIFGVLASTSIVFSAAYTIYMFNRIAFGGWYSKFFELNIPDLNKRELYMLLTLIIFTVLLGIYPALVLDGINYYVSTLIYSNSA
uniref:NADH-ubiquinone oxidoreductase chain 4 n=1 Tax=Bacidia sp. TaxID=2040699 RepID=A0A482JWD6_9LECA|nr:NADH dehydrogenase subunit 4 [Bacidia sp.]